MKQLNLRILRNLTLISLVLSAAPAYSQMHCRTTLGSHLTPIMGTDHLMAFEASMAPGVITDYRLQGGMYLLAFDFSLWNESNLYFEGGYKNWSKVALDDEAAEDVNLPELDSRHIGVRQLFYSFDTPKMAVKVGLHETKLGNYLLVDERILGGSIDRNFDAVDVNVRVGTVLQNFARMGQFCANRHLYNLVQDDFTENIGEKPGETNLIGAVINWNPNYEAPEQSTSDDEFSEFDEFGEFDEFSDEAGESSIPIIENVGLILYQEMGSIIEDPKQYVGSLIDLNLPGEIMMRTGAVYQSMEDNNALVYIMQARKAFMWNSGMNTDLIVSYIGKSDMDDEALFQPLFSNLFIGEVMRMDATSFPLATAEIKHRFGGKLRYKTALKAVGQVEGDKTREIDLENSIHLFEHVQATLLISHMTSDVIETGFPEGVNMVRMEVRVAF